MSFDWQEYKRLADDLYEADGSPDSEAENRSAISRAYYSAYNEARQHAPDYVLRGSHKHRKLISYFQQQGGSQERKIGRLLETLRDNRNDADYESDIGGPRQCALKAESSLYLAGEIQNQLDELDG